MKKMKKRILSVAVALLMSLVCLIPGSPIQAASTNTTTTFDKYLVLNQDANVPNVTFTFSIAAGAALDATSTTPRIEAGIGTPVIGSATFGPTDTTYTTVQSGDTATLNSGEQYAKKTVSVDFSNISFTEPGIFRYIITEGASTASGIANDAESTRTLDVYVGYSESADGTLDIMGYVLHKGSDAIPDAADKDKGFQNTYSTKNLTLKKVVTGNQGDRNKEFNFTVTISGATVGNRYTVVPSKTGDPTQLTVGANGSVSGNFHIKHNETVVIQGLAPNDQFAISEADYSSAGYSTSYQINGGTQNTGKQTAATNMGNTAQTVVFTNHRASSVATGVLMDFTPYLLLGVVALAGSVMLIVFSKKRRAH